MTRILLQYLLPLLGPLTVYLIYMSFRRRRAKKSGDDIPAIEKSHVFWSIVVGFALMIGGLAFLAVSTGEDPGAGTYQAPRLEDGRIVPPKFQ
jgi:hypothetical protein